MSAAAGTRTPGSQTPGLQTLWIDPTFGASGDMLLGALAGLLGSIDPLDELTRLGVDGYTIESGAAIRNGLSAHRVAVRLDRDPAAPPTHRRWSTIDRLLADADLPDAVAAGARATFRRLGEIEAAQHGVTIDDVHFHEVGAIDAIVDIVGAWLLLDALRHSSPIDRVVVGPVGLGHGTVVAAHGILPLPAPATIALLTDRPVRSLDLEGETCTPTGAALLVTMADEWGPLPTGTPHDVARGAGGRDPDTHPNVLTALIIEAVDSSDDDSSDDETTEPAVIIETNVDDVTPETLSHVIERLLDAGADDAWVIPIVMKKSRPAHELRVLCRPAIAADLRALISGETGSLGTRTLTVTKHPLPRSTVTVDVRGEPIDIKVGPHGAKPEYDQVAALATRLDIPLRTVVAEALDAMNRSRDEGEHPGTATAAR